MFGPRLSLKTVKSCQILLYRSNTLENTWWIKRPTLESVGGPRGAPLGSDNFMDFLHDCCYGMARFNCGNGQFDPDEQCQKHWKKPWLMLARCLPSARWGNFPVWKMSVRSYQSARYRRTVLFSVYPQTFVPSRAYDDAWQLQGPKESSKPFSNLLCTPRPQIKCEIGTGRSHWMAFTQSCTAVNRIGGSQNDWWSALKHIDWVKESIKFIESATLAACS